MEDSSFPPEASLAASALATVGVFSGRSWHHMPGPTLSPALDWLVSLHCRGFAANHLPGASLVCSVYYNDLSFLSRLAFLPGRTAWGDRMFRSSSLLFWLRWSCVKRYRPLCFSHDKRVHPLRRSFASVPTEPQNDFYLGRDPFLDIPDLLLGVGRFYNPRVAAFPNSLTVLLSSVFSSK